MKKHPARAAFWRSFATTAALLMLIVIVLWGMGRVRTAAEHAGFGTGYPKSLQVCPLFFSQRG